MAFAFFGEGDNPLFVGSMKTVVGHTEGTALLACLRLAWLCSSVLSLRTCCSTS